MPSRWREVIWADARGREVDRLACHESELAGLLARPFPPGVAAREVYELTAIGSGTRFACRRPYRVGDTFEEFINQGERLCVVVSVVEETGDYLYEYRMPGGRVFYRDQYGRSVNPRRVPAKFGMTD